MVAEEIHSYRGFTKTRTELKYALFSLKCYQRHSHVTTTFSCFSIHLPTSLVSEGAQLSFIVGGTSGKEPTYQSRRHKRHRCNPWVGKIPWRRKCQPTPVFLPGKSQGQRSLAGYSPWGHKVSDTTEYTHTKSSYN